MLLSDLDGLFRVFEWHQKSVLELIQLDQFDIVEVRNLNVNLGRLNGRDNINLFC